MSLFLSKFVNKVDRKGRVSVPASFRAKISASQDFAGIFCMPSENTPSLICMTQERMDALAASLDAQADAFSPEQQYAGHLMFGETTELSWDSEGRILLPAELLTHAGIAEQAVFVGLGRTFEIWEPEAHKAHVASLRATTGARPALRLGTPATPSAMGGGGNG